MPGTFTVVGTHVLEGRGLVAYGDIQTGDVRSGDLLVIPLNGSTAMSAVIRSVEAVDGTATGSHVGLLLGQDDSEIRMLRALELEGETLEIAASDLDVYAARMSFDEAKASLANLLLRVDWPSPVVWVHASQIISFPGHVFVLCPEGRFEPENAARATFEQAVKRCPAVRVGGVGVAGGATIAAVWPIIELGQGEIIFIEKGVKVNVPASQPRITVTRSRLRWWFIRRALRKWIERRDAALRTA